MEKQLPGAKKTEKCRETAPFFNCRQTPCITFVQYRGGIQYGGIYIYIYHDACGGISWLPWGMFSTMGDHDKCGGYLEYRGGYHEYRGGLS